MNCRASGVWFGAMLYLGGCALLAGQFNFTQARWLVTGLQISALKPGDAPVRDEKSEPVAPGSGWRRLRGGRG